MATDGLLIAKGVCDVALRPRMANRHGLVAGATGTGKTVTLQTMAQAFSAIGVPVFLADVKGDLTGLARAGGRENKKVAERLDRLGLGAFRFEPCPVAFWDVFGEQGLPMRATVSEMGPLLLGRLLNLNETQAGILTLGFRVADDEQLALLDLKDLRSLVQFVGENAKQLRTTYGNVSTASVGAIQRALLTLEEQGGEHLFGEPALALGDLLKTDPNGKGVVNILAADKLLHSPTVYASFLLWLLAELFETLPEVGDLDKPKLVFFFDEAHLLFNDAPKGLVDKVEQVVRLIRSKGVGVYFVTQNPRDVPDLILGQLGNRVQHALRAFTPRDRKAVRAAAETFRSNPDLDVATVITELGIGEALVSVLDEHGMPTPVERALIVPPPSHIGPILADERRQMILSSSMYTHYTHQIDRESAYEVLQKRAIEAEAAKEAAEAEKLEAIERKERLEATIKREKANARAPASRRETATEAMAKSTARSFGTSLGRFLSRNLLGVLGLGESKRRSR